MNTLARICMLLALMAAQQRAVFAADTAPETRLPVPDEKAREQAAEKATKLHGKYIAGAKTSGDQSVLAKQIAHQAEFNTTDTALRFMLWQQSLELATKAGDVKTAYRVTEKISRHYQVDPFVALPTILGNITERITVRNQLEARELYAELLSQALEIDRHDLTEALAEKLVSLSQRFGDTAAKKSASNTLVEVQIQKKNFAEITPALKTLETDPQQPAANELVGKYLLEKGKSEQAAVKLALSSDPVYRELATKLVKPAASFEEQLALGDICWKIAADSKGTLQARLQALAGTAYRQALPAATGFDKAKIEVRLKELAKLPASAISPRVPTP